MVYSTVLETRRLAGKTAIPKASTPALMPHYLGATLPELVHSQSWSCQIDSEYGELSTSTRYSRDPLVT